MQHTSNPKVQARHLQRLLTEAGTPTSHAQAQQLVARSLGFPSWQALKAVPPAPPQPVLAYVLDVIMHYGDGQTYTEELWLASADERAETRAYLLGLLDLFDLRGHCTLIDRRTRTALNPGEALTTRAETLRIFLESSEYHRMTGNDLPEVLLTIGHHARDVSHLLDRLAPDVVRAALLDEGRAGPHTDRLARHLLRRTPQGPAYLDPRELLRWLAVKASQDPAWCGAHEATLPLSA
ncbi:glyoxalase superfamily protein [Deinococcus soli (ex Cha et al. 2016)]|uniref:Glyoxalase-related protein domain-containing protein n=2 Tax=Deinococcus soli (ex Cha et al. 2016) TaxID=1309411 RepID=A0AAE3XCY6_9DEIO|nr:glyoxalase superfamily protein [Deinococcus soli (ex Cha et al. 2016)]MDR6218618.1 hypothetical protein [Deinococcus soli (ex Cha et al. 2016)]MDR6328415.1 hypothetical protein [Deinococcus soli (ex Cha et al. 2016)]MDR6753026.1 hypothetical protein [Deinococcus soli (ex Cha et al. 2016)]